MKLETRYSIGDVVWGFSLQESRRSLQCPDCLGTQKWEAHTPAGEVLTFSCPRCTGWIHDSRPEAREVTATTMRLTIGSVSVDTSDTEGPRYMCEETGVGSGRIWRGIMLFDTESSAQSAGDSRAAARLQEVTRDPKYQADRLAHGCTFTSKAIEEADLRRRKYQFQAEDASRAVFDESLSDAEVREQLKSLLETV